MIDIVILGAIVLFARQGYKKGLIKSVLTLGSSLVALVIAFIIQPMVTMFLEKTPLYTWLYDMIANKVAEIQFIGDLKQQGEMIAENITWLPKVLTEQITADNNRAIYEMLDVSTIQEYVALSITNILLGILALFLGWFILKIALGIGVRLLSSIVDHIFIVASLNRYGGLAIGIIKGMLMFSLAALILPVLIEIPMVNELHLAIQSSMIGSWLYENNLIIILYNSLL